DGNLDINNVQAANIRNESGNIRVQGIKSNLTLRDTSGEIVVSDVGGSVDITDTSGQIRVNRAGAITIHDTDGNISVESASSLDVVEKESGEVMVRNVAGAVHVPSKIKLKQRS